MLVYFPHIPKTGGQTLLQCFYKTFGAEKCIKVWNPNFGADVDQKGFVELNETQFEGIAAVVGHLKVSEFLSNRYIQREFKKGNVKILTSVRDPIKRILSTYNFIIHREKHRNYEAVSQQSIQEFFKSFPGNSQFSYLKQGTDSTLDEIFQMMRIFPIENSITGFTGFFEKYFNVNLGKLEMKNRAVNWGKGKKLLSVDDIPDDFIEDLRNRNKIDFELYHRSFCN